MAVESMSRLQSMLRRAFNEHHARPALWVAGRLYTYAEIWDTAQAIAAKLLDRLGAEETVGVLAQRSLSAYVGILGAVLAGRGYVPLNMKVPVGRQASMVATARCGAFISDAKSDTRRRELSAALGREDFEIVEHAIREKDRAKGADVAAGDDGRIAYVMFTSGTTGAPKGVAVTRDNLRTYLDAVACVAEFEPGARCSQLFDLSFDLSVHDIFRTWTGGGCLYIMTDEETIDPAGFARRHELECWFSVPSVVAMAKRLNRLGAGSLPSLRLSLFCGEALPTSIAKQWVQVAPNSRIFNLYGPTEATIAITACLFRPEACEGLATVPLGEAFAGSAAVVLGESGDLVPLGNSGELWLGGAQIAPGYINNASENSQRFVRRRIEGFPFDRWYRTGDIARADPAHGLIFQGRRDHQVKINGYRVELLEIEEALRIAAECADVAAAPWPISPDGAAEGIVAFICESSRSQADILAGCRTRLPSYMVPQRVVTVQTIPINANGKVDRAALIERHLRRTAKEPAAQSTVNVN